MSFNVNEFKSQLTGGGARPTQFQVILQKPTAVSGNLSNISPFMVKAAQLPESTLGVVNVPYFGRNVKIAGDREFGEWTVTVINDEDFAIRNVMEEWMSRINSHEGNIRNIGDGNPLSYQVDADVIQYSKVNNPIRTYTFKNIWPSTISPIELSWETTNTIEEFQITFQYDWWEVTGATASGVQV